MRRSFVTIVQENYPNRLGVLFVVRLPPVVRVIAQTFIQVRLLSCPNYADAHDSRSKMCAIVTSRTFA